MLEQLISFSLARAYLLLFLSLGAFSSATLLLYAKFGQRQNEGKGNRRSSLFVGAHAMNGRVQRLALGQRTCGGGGVLFVLDHDFDEASHRNGTDRHEDEVSADNRE